MAKKHLIVTAALAVASLLSLSVAGCKQSAPVAATTIEANPESGVFPIAYVRMDSVSAQYQLSIEIQEKLAKDAEEGRTRLMSKGNALQKAAQEFERRARINAFVSQEAAQAEQNKLLKMQQEGQVLEAELSQQLAAKQQLMLEDMMNKIQEQLKEFIKDRKYKMVLTQVGVLYAEDATDITEEFIKYLNDNYKSESATVAPAPADSTSKK